MADTVADYLLKRLGEWEVKRIYGFPGMVSMASWRHWKRAGDKPKFIRARHQELTAFMACAHAKFTGEIGVCLATSDPGAIHLVNGLYDQAGSSTGRRYRRPGGARRSEGVFNRKYFISANSLTTMSSGEKQTANK
jgi:glyoxylate carboligase